MNDWQRFAKGAAKMMRDARENKVPLRAASDFFEHALEITNRDLQRYAEAMVWEIDAVPALYDELLRMFETSGSEADAVGYLTSK